VQGELRDDVKFSNIIKSTFPGGSITGAPKIAAMQCISDLEKVPRELYTGTIGYLDVNGDLDLNIVIRTIICVGNKAFFSSGGGITWDSDQEYEYSESLLKIKALKEALCFA
jgi:para-aminobenzoate synthetase component I